MYLLTIIAMQVIVIYRQFSLSQDILDFQDIAILVVVNSLFLIFALLYLGAIVIYKLKIKSILLVYCVIVILGSLLTYAKYNIFQRSGLSFGQLFEELLIIFAVSAIIMFFSSFFQFWENGSGIKKWRIRQVFIHGIANSYI